MSRLAISNIAWDLNRRRPFRGLTNEWRLGWSAGTVWTTRTPNRPVEPRWADQHGAWEGAHARGFPRLTAVVAGLAGASPQECTIVYFSPSLTEFAVALVLAVGGSLFTVGIVALPNMPGVLPLHTELQQTLGPIERGQESDGDLLLKPLGVPAIWSWSVIPLRHP